ncbi:MAG: isochorismatase family protein [Calditrichaeota bacterium]|nr:isochorismatase family protein [Calditrichota bacterium]
MRFQTDTSVAVMVDIQERLTPHMHNHFDLLKNCQILIKGIHHLSVPLLVTEQYKKGLGDTIGVLNKLVTEDESIEKMCFSCADDKGFMSLLKKYKRQQVILFGIEAHVCVYQTAEDLLTAGYEVTVVGDCTASRKEENKKTALEQLRHNGVRILNYESVLLELCRVSGTDLFKKISQLIK